MKKLLVCCSRIITLVPNFRACVSAHSLLLSGDQGPPNFTYAKTAGAPVPSSPNTRHSLVGSLSDAAAVFVYVRVFYCSPVFTYATPAKREAMCPARHYFIPS